MKDINFQLSTPFANEFVRFAKAYIDQKNRLQVLTMAHGRIDGKMLYVQGTDRNKVFELALPLLSASVEHGEFLLSPPGGLFDKRSAYVDVTAGVEATTYRSLNDSITLSVEKGTYPDLSARLADFRDKANESEQLTIYFSPSLLASALKAFDQKVPVKMTFTTDRAPAFITQGCANVMVLPVRHKEDA